MARKSKIDRLPAEVRDLIARGRADGMTIRELHGEPAALGVRVSPSALGRHVQRLDAADPAALGEVVDGLRRELRAFKLELRAGLRDVLAALRERP